MPVDFGLLNSQTPVAVKPFQMNTPDENAAIHYDMQGKQVRAEQATHEYQNELGDEAKLKTILSQDGVDYMTPEGNQKLLSEAQKAGVSQGKLLELSTHAQKVQEAHRQNEINALKLPAAEREAYMQQFEMLAPMTSEADRKYDETVKTKGQAAADAELRESYKQIVAKMPSAKGLNGKPLFDPQFVQNLDTMDPNVLHAYNAGTNYTKDQLENVHKKALVHEEEAQAALKKKEAEILGDLGKDPYVFQGAPGDNGMYFQSRENPGKIVRKDAVTGEVVPVNVVPRGATKPATATAIQQDKTNAAELTPEQQKVLADAGIAGVKFTMPPGRFTPEAANKMRAAFADEIIAAGGVNNVNAQQAQQIATRAGLQQQIKTETAINSTASDIKYTMSGIEEELRKLDGPDSQKVRALWKTAVSEWGGDPEFQKLKTYMTNLQEQAGRLFSRATGAAGTPATFLNLSKEVNNGDMNLGQFVEHEKAMNSLADWSRQSTEQEINRLRGDYSKWDFSGKGAKSSTRDQKSRDTDAATIVGNEYNTAVDKLAAAKTPAERIRAQEAVRDARKELSRLPGVKLPPAGEKLDLPKQEGIAPKPTVSNW